MKYIDASFLKFYLNDLAAAVMNDNIPAYGTKYSGFVHMLPNETFCQISNCETDIAFGGNLKAELVDGCGVVLMNLTDRFFYTEVTDRNGIKQIKYAFGLISQDFGQELVYLKLTHTVSEKIWYSAAFIVTYDESEETDLFHYGNTDYFRGIPYEKFDSTIYAPQWIRLACFMTDGDYDQEGDADTQTSGRKLSGRITLSKFRRHIFRICDQFTYDRLVTLLKHDVIYLNGKRVTDKPVAEKGERIEDSNIFEGAAFNAYVDEEPLPEYVNLFESLSLISELPLGTYTLSSLPDTIVGTFNKNITLNTGTVKLFKDGVLFATFTQADIIVSDAGFTIDTSGLTFENASYFVQVSAGLFSAGLEIFEGVNDESWAFEISAGDYDGDDYDEDDYLTE